MNQKSPLLHYRIKCNSVEPVVTEETSYDIASGLWIDKYGEPLIKMYINNHLESNSCETLITETRESADRSESSNIFNSIETATRESIDRAEKSHMGDLYANNKNKVSILGQTIETRTRESIDRSERASGYSEHVFQSIQTFTRESIDRSEKA